MKTTLKASLVVLVSILLYFFFSASSYKTTNIVTPNKQSTAYYTSGWGNNFIFGSFNSGWDILHGNITAPLGFNAWHIYSSEVTGFDGRHYMGGWTHPNLAPGDSLFTANDDYVTQVNSVLSQVPAGMNAYLDRPKLAWLRYGQRSDYQCEYVSPDPDNNDLWFYAFNCDSSGQTYTGASVTDNTVFGDGAKVKECLTSTHGAGWVVDRLRANGEQGLPYGLKSPYGDSAGTWFIKPKIRIDSSVVDNAPNTLVCKIKVIGQDGITVLKDVDIRASNFVDVDNNYDGSYIEHFENLTEELEIQGTWSVGESKGFLFESRGTRSDDDYNKADIQVYWYDSCNMWIDYVRVDNDIAHDLFSTDPLNTRHQEYMEWLEFEAEIAEHSNSYRYYLELFEFNNIPCMEYVFKKLDTLCSKDVTLIATVSPVSYAGHVPWEDRLSVWNTGHFKRNFLDKVGAKEIMIASYPFNSQYNYPENYSGAGYDTWSRIPNTLPRHSGVGTLAKDISPADYETWLDNEMNDAPYCFEEGYPSTAPRYTVEHDPGNFRHITQFGDQLSRETGLPFIFHTSAHLWYRSSGDVGDLNNADNRPMAEIKGEVNREPTNEELNMTTNISLTYGAKGIVFFELLSYGDSGNAFYSRGITQPWNATIGLTPRTYNAYNQPKWDNLIALSERLKKWEPYIMSFNNADRHSYIYHLASERSAMLSNSYIGDVISYKSASGYPICAEDRPDSTIPGDALPTSGKRLECKEDRYLQVATFENSSEPRTNYFMIVNRRCSPYKDESSEDNRGGQRFFYVVFNEDDEELDGFNNWVIQEIGGNARYEFHKNMYQRINLGEFRPGEGKLYKMVPTPIAGGTLKGDENISGQTFTCLDTVYNNGFNITIDSGSTVSFTDSAAIIMEGGTFQSGVLGSPSGQLTTFKGAGSSKWGGMRFTHTNVKIYNTKFQDISSPSVNYAVKMYNCPLGDIRGSQFVMSTDTSGAVQSVYATTGEDMSYQGMYFISNTVTMNNSRGTGICVQGFGGMTMDHFIVNSKFDSDGLAIGITLSGVTGGSIKRNTFTGFSTAVNTLASTVDIAQNVITNTSGVSKGITGYSLSALNLAPAGSMYTGGYNTITNTYGASVNIETDNSMPVIEYGNNIFDIDNGSLPYAYHLYGSFWEDSYPVQINGNCYKLSGTPVADESYISSSVTAAQVPVALTFKDVNCGFSLPGYTEIVDIGGGIYDTIPSTSEGMGGSFSSVELTPRQMYAGLRKQVARRNYEEAKNLCYDLIGSYPDSLESIASLQTLYLCTIKTDTSEISSLKAFYETLILNHGDNGALVTAANYLSQKCKVMLRQYSSAMTGFQQIVNANQYNYLGLVARWDYMATSLIAPGGGGYPSMYNEQLSMTNFESDESGKFEELYGDDKNPFTKDEKKQIYTSVKAAFETAKNDDDRKIKTLEDNSKKGDVVSTKQLQQMQTLKQIVKTEKPKTIIEHIRIVGSDMQKVFGNTSPVSNSKGNSIPTEFSLGQNYPNPFNPVTTIKYALPHDAKVVIKIYDILGREVKMLINQVQQAGYYDVKFDGSVYASGVYFYRIEAYDPSTPLRVTYTVSKKMVLVK